MPSNQTEQWMETLAADGWAERAAASARLQALGEQAVPALLVGATNPDERTRAESIALMDHLADNRCVGALEYALNDPSARVRRHAVHSVGCQQCKVVPLAIDIVCLLVPRALHDTSPRVRQVAVHQLGLQNPDPRAIAALETILRQDTDPKLRSRAEFALRKQRAGA